MNLSQKTGLFFTTLAAIVVLTLLAISSYSFRHIYLEAAKTLTRTAAEIVRVHLTESMVNGTIGKRKAFLDRLNSVYGLERTTITRAPDVVAQYGPGLNR